MVVDWGTSRAAGAGLFPVDLAINVLYVMALEAIAGWCAACDEGGAASGEGLHTGGGEDQEGLGYMSIANPPSPSPSSSSSPSEACDAEEEEGADEEE